MGTSQCNLLQSVNTQYQYVGREEHQTFGSIYCLKNEKKNEQVGVKKIAFNSIRQMQAYVSQVQQAIQYCQLLPLIKILKVERVQSQDKTKQHILSSITQCLAFDPHVMLHFCYHSSDSSLFQALQKKKESVKVFLSKKVNQNIDLNLSSTVKLNEYRKIDNLPERDRKYINFFFRQIEILKFIDQIVTALYGLNHFEVSHSAIRPKNIFLNQQSGKVYLAQKKIFQLRTNFQKTLELINSANTDCIYLQPQSLVNIGSALAQGPKFVLDQKVNQKSKKADIFCLGLIVIQLCLLERISDEIYEPVLNKKSKESIALKFNQNELIKCLSRVKSKYSDGFVDLIQGMVKRNPENRLNYEQIIKHLQILVNQNRQILTQVFSRNDSFSKSKASGLQGSRTGSFALQNDKRSSSSVSLHLNMSHSGISSSVKTIPRGGNNTNSFTNLSNTNTINNNNDTFLLQKKANSHQNNSSNSLLSIELYKKLQSLSNRMDIAFAQNQLKTKDMPDRSIIQKSQQIILKQLQHLSRHKRENEKTIDRNQTIRSPACVELKPGSSFSFSNDKCTDNDKDKGKYPQQNSHLSRGFQDKESRSKSNVSPFTAVQGQFTGRSFGKPTSNHQLKKQFLQGKARFQQQIGGSLTTIVVDSPKKDHNIDIHNYKMKKLNRNGFVGKGKSRTQHSEQQSNLLTKSQLQKIIKNKNTLKARQQNIDKQLNSCNVKELKGNELYAMYIKEYQNISTDRRQSN